MMKVGADTLETGCDLIDVTSVHRPDTDWRLTDANGHEHRWYVDGHPATTYSPSAKHETPTLVWIFEYWGYWEDGTRYAVWHHECRECGERIEPRYTADTTMQYIPGLRWCRINGKRVSKEEFEQKLNAIAFDQLLKIDHNTTVRCADGAFGLLIRWHQDTHSVGVQVPGEDTIRDIPAGRLFDMGGGALSEHPVVTKTTHD